jgi:hypothetical protein
VGPRCWGARIRTWEWRLQRPLPYHLATPQCTKESAFGNLFSGTEKYRIPILSEPNCNEDESSIRLAVKVGRAFSAFSGVKASRCRKGSITKNKAQLRKNWASKIAKKWLVVNEILEIDGLLALLSIRLRQEKYRIEQELFQARPKSPECQVLGKKDRMTPTNPVILNIGGLRDLLRLLLCHITTRLN